LRRVARLADGWMSLGDPTPDLPRLRQYMQEAGRDPAALMVRGPLLAGDGGEAAWVAAGKRLQSAGVTHLNITAPVDLSPAQASPRIIEARRVLGEALG
jgi:alkanesulfonate monooxygenase SsuD/methylene tetrahydromethanopterin reductase-like flavin-dependent oxidoreductase (luciferase family)